MICIQQGLLYLKCSSALEDVTGRHSVHQYQHRDLPPSNTRGITSSFFPLLLSWGIFFTGKSKIQIFQKFSKNPNFSKFFKKSKFFNQKFSIKNPNFSKIFIQKYKFFKNFQSKIKNFQKTCKDFQSKIQIFQKLKKKSKIFKNFQSKIQIFQKFSKCFHKIKKIVKKVRNGAERGTSPPTLQI